MRNFRNLVSLLLLIVFHALPQALYAQKRYSAKVEKDIKEVENNLGLWVKIEGVSNTLKQQMNLHKVNGVSIAVIKNYKLEWARGYGWADSVEQRPVTTHTLFQAGSISKSLNGVGVLKMAQDKRLDLYADINDYLVTWKFPYDSLSKNKKISTANLLSHTAGLSVHGFIGYKREDTIPTLVQLLNGERPSNTAAVRSIFEPGLKFKYSGGGIMISQLILQDLTKLPYDVFMWKNVLNPLGMKNSSYTNPPVKDKQKLLASAYYEDGQEVKGQYRIYPQQAAAGLWTNPTDLANYIIEIQLASHGKSNKVLTQEMTKLMLTPYIDKYAALGIYISNKGSKTYFHNDGSDEGFVTQIYGSMEGGNGVVVMANTQDDRILGEIVNSVATVYQWKDFYNPQLKKVIEPDYETLKAYSGKYQIQNSDTLLLKSEDNGLFLHQGDFKAKLRFTANSSFFFIEIPGSEFEFTKDSHNKVTGFTQKKGTEIFSITKIE